MNFKLLRFSVGLVSIACLAGCDPPTYNDRVSPATETEIHNQTKPDIKVETPRGDMDVKTVHGGVDIDVDRKRTPPDVPPLSDGNADVQVTPGGGVKADVDGAAIRERIQERREEKELERDLNK